MMSLVVGSKKILLILSEECVVLLLCLGCPGLRNFDRSICDWEYEIVTFHWRQHFLCIEPSGVEFRCVHLLQFFNVCDHNVTPRLMHNREICLARLLSRTDEVSIGLSQKWGDTRPLLQTGLLVHQMVFRTAFHTVSSHQTRQIAVTFHGIRPPFFTQTGLQ